ncbi:hypothetical protein AADZ90_017345 [Aestuariibius sp. 2305UL40-4]|uniref:hypothetical protein n=1 Tax=Aestuariibius violaceus TaxID=3234132 RepID=UPI00345E4391
MRLAAILLALVLGGTAGADTPKTPPTDWQRDYDGVVVSADAGRARIEVLPESADIPPWSVDRYAHVAVPDPTGRFLLIPNADNLISSNDPDFVVYELYAAPGDRIGEVRLEQLIETYLLVPTVSHFIWVSNEHDWSGGGWRLTTPDGGRWKLKPDPFLLILE